MLQSDERVNKSNRDAATQHSNPKVFRPTIADSGKDAIPEEAASFCIGPACLPSTEGPAAVAMSTARNAAALSLVPRGPVMLN